MLDFRPRMANDGEDFTGTGAKVIDLPRNNDLITLDEDYYLGHAGVIFAHKQNYGGAYIGTASRAPLVPATADTREHLKIATYQINPYMLDDEDMTINYIDNRGYKMKDIANLERKVDELTEVVAMNSLELATTAIDVLDSSGVNRLKSGITADNFQNHAFSDTTLPVDTKRQLILLRTNCDQSLLQDQSNYYTPQTVHQTLFLLVRQSYVNLRSCSLEKSVSCIS